MSKLIEHVEDHEPIARLFPIQYPRKGYLHPHKSNDQFIASSETSFPILLREMNCGSRHSPNSRYQGQFHGKKKAGTVFGNLTAGYNIVWHRCCL